VPVEGPWQTPNFRVVLTKWGSLRLAPIIAERSEATNLDDGYSILS